MAMLQQELVRYNAGEIIYYIRFDSETLKVSEFGCFNKSDHSVQGTLTRPSGVMDSQKSFLPNGAMATWDVVRNGMNMLEIPDEPGFYDCPYQVNTGD